MHKNTAGSPSFSFARNLPFEIPGRHGGLPLRKPGRTQGSPLRYRQHSGLYLPPPSLGVFAPLRETRFYNRHSTCKKRRRTQILRRFLHATTSKIFPETAVPLRMCRGWFRAPSCLFFRAPSCSSRYGVTLKILSSAAAGLPRPSRLLVAKYTSPRGPTRTSRNRPNCPWNNTSCSITCILFAESFSR